VSKEVPKTRGSAGDDGLAPNNRDTALGDELRVGGNSSGRVKFDDRGNAVWEWSVKTGVFGREASTSRLKKLEHPALSLIDDAPPPAPLAPLLVKANPKGVAQGYSPYDSGVLAKSKSDSPPLRKKDLRRLGEWLKLRKQAGKNNTDEE
jgi:hypothetical protein